MKYEKTVNGYKWNEINYETVDDIIHGGILGFCNCGNPEDNLDYIRGGLALIDSRWSGDKKCPDSKPELEWNEWHKNHDKHKLDYFGNEHAANFFFYWADQAGLTEHGGCVNGSWLSERGLELLKDLQGLIPKSRKG